MNAETFVMPIGRNRPSFFKNPKGRLKLEFRRLRNFVGGFVRCLPPSPRRNVDVLHS